MLKKPDVSSDENIYKPEQLYEGILASDLKELYSENVQEAETNPDSIDSLIKELPKVQS